MKDITIRYPYDRDITITRDDDYCLEDAFAEFNAGSSRECPEFTEARIRSLSVGDLVRWNGNWYICKSIGWEKMTEEEVMDYMTAIESKLIELRTLENDPNLPPWFAINDVVYKVKKSEAGGRWYYKAS